MVEAAISRGARERVDSARPLDDLLRTCIHCGLCLTACPTYLATGDEAESPRGRLLIMSELLAEAPVLRAVEASAREAPLDRGSLDRCLGCRNCETVCPSGVPYGHLLEESRTALGPDPRGISPLVTWLLDHVMSHPRRLALASGLARLAAPRPLRAWLPGSLRTLLDSLPDRMPAWSLPALLESSGNVALLAGCAQRVYMPEVLPATARLVRAAGGRPFVPAGQGCCGALSHHVGSTEAALEMARKLVQAFEGAEEIVVPSAGCSAHMRGYGELLRDEPRYAARALRLAERTFDLVEWLAPRADSLRFQPDARKVVYHPPCHHVHAQRIVDAPFQLLQRIPRLEVVRIAEEERCCGSAGSYSLSHPDLAARVRAEKLARVLSAEPDLLVTANPGCELYLQQGLRQWGRNLRVVHLAPFLAAHLPDEP